MIIDNEDFVDIMKIATRTAQRWRDEGKIAFSRIGAKIYYTEEDIEAFLENHHNQAFAIKNAAKFSERFSNKWQCHPELAEGRHAELVEAPPELAQVPKIINLQS